MTLGLRFDWKVERGQQRLGKEPDLGGKNHHQVVGS